MRRRERYGVGQSTGNGEEEHHERTEEQNNQNKSAPYQSWNRYHYIRDNLERRKRAAMRSCVQVLEHSCQGSRCFPFGRPTSRLRPPRRADAHYLRYIITLADATNALERRVRPPPLFPMILQLSRAAPVVAYRTFLRR